MTPVVMTVLHLRGQGYHTPRNLAMFTVTKTQTRSHSVAVRQWGLVLRMDFIWSYFCTRWGDPGVYFQIDEWLKFLVNFYFYIILGYYYIIYYIYIFNTLHFCFVHIVLQLSTEVKHFMLAPSTTNDMTTRISLYLFRSLCVSPSSFFSLCCRRLCRAVGVTLGGGGQGVSWRSSELWSPVGFTQKTCCSTTERIVLSRKLGKKKENFTVNLNFENDLTFLYKMIKQHNITCCIKKGTKSTYFTTSRVRWTGDRRSLKEKQVGRMWITATENRWSLQVTEQRSENPSGSPSCSRRSRNPMCMSELFLHLCTISWSSESD